MDTERPHVRAGFAFDPEHSETAFLVVFEHFQIVHCADTKGTFDSADNRWQLEEGAFAFLEGLVDLLDVFDGFRDTEDCDVFFAGILLALNQSSCSVEADDETTGDFRIEGTAVTGFLDVQCAFGPCDDFVGGWIRRFVEIDNTAPVEKNIKKFILLENSILLQVFINRSLKWGISLVAGCKMTFADIHFLEVL